MGAVRHPHGETVILHPYNEHGVDRYNNPSPSFGPDIERKFCAVAPRQSGIDRNHDYDGSRWAVSKGFIVYDSMDSPITERDQLTIRGVRHYVDGDVERWSSPFRDGHGGTVVRTLRVDG